MAEDNQQGLVEKMNALADKGGERHEELRARAAELYDAIRSDEWSAKKMLVAWARARKLWFDVTGEPLI